MPEYPNTSPPEPSGPRYSARVALSCKRGHAPGQVLHALQELRQVIDDRLRDGLGNRYDRHSAESVGTDKNISSHRLPTFEMRGHTFAVLIEPYEIVVEVIAAFRLDLPP